MKHICINFCFRSETLKIVMLRIAFRNSLQTCAFWTSLIIATHKSLVRFTKLRF